MDPFHIKCAFSGWVGSAWARVGPCAWSVIIETQFTTPEPGDTGRLVVPETAEGKLPCPVPTPLPVRLIPGPLLTCTPLSGQTRAVFCEK